MLQLSIKENRERARERERERETERGVIRNLALKHFDNSNHSYYVFLQAMTVFILKTKKKPQPQNQ